MAQHVVHLLVVGEVIGSNLGLTLHRVVTKDVKNGSYCCYVWCMTLIVVAGGMPLTKTGATHQLAQLGLPCNIYNNKYLLYISNNILTLYFHLTNAMKYCKHHQRRQKRGGC